MTPRYARKVDSTQREVVAALRQAGCLVLIVNGVFDLLVYRGVGRSEICEDGVPVFEFPVTWRLYMVDCKGPTTRKTAAQQQLERDGWPLIYLRSAAEAERFASRG